MSPFKSKGKPYLGIVFGVKPDLSNLKFDAFINMGPGEFLRKGISVPPPPPGFGTIESYDLDTWQVWEGGRSALGEAVAHAPPARRGARSTTRGYAPLEYTAMVAFGNHCEPFSIVTPTRAKL